MKQIALIFGLLATQASLAQSADPNEVVLQDALRQLSFQQTLFLQLNGSVTFHGKVTPVVSNLSWSANTAGTTPTMQVDLKSYVNGALVKRIVGDGSTLWSYDLKQHQYSATSYGGTPGLARPEGYVSHLLSDLNWAATGSDGYLAKLLRQIYNPANLNYESWMPGIPTIQLRQGIPQKDPVNPDVIYYPSAGNDFYFYNASPRRTIVMQIASGLTSPTGGAPVSGLENVYFNQLDMVGKDSKLTQWIITPYSGIVFDQDLFTPYGGKYLYGWKMIVAPRPVTR